jgi:hypothetical protein
LRNAKEYGASGWRGHETLTTEIINRVETYSKGSSKDLVNHMQFD